jgi:DNA-binding transcriptional LysR family regulator
MIDGDLTYFLTIARTGTLARAAEQLGISQPAVTKAIQRLERKVGVTLVERTARGSVLTEAGKIFHTRVSGVSMQLDSAVQEARDAGGGHTGLLRVGATPATTSFALRSLFPTLLVERPAARFSVTTAFSDALLDAIDKREVELAVCPLPETLDASMAKEVLYDDHYSLMVSTAHPLAKKGIGHGRRSGGLRMGRVHSTGICTCANRASLCKTGTPSPYARCGRGE